MASEFSTPLQVIKYYAHNMKASFASFSAWTSTPKGNKSLEQIKAMGVNVAASCHRCLFSDIHRRMCINTCTHMTHTQRDRQIERNNQTTTKGKRGVSLKKRGWWVARSFVDVTEHQLTHRRSQFILRESSFYLKQRWQKKYNILRSGQSTHFLIKGESENLIWWKPCFITAKLKFRVLDKNWDWRELLCNLGRFPVLKVIPTWSVMMSLHASF